MIFHTLPHLKVNYENKPMEFTKAPIENPDQKPSGCSH